MLLLSMNSSPSAPQFLEKFEWSEKPLRCSNQSLIVAVWIEVVVDVGGEFDFVVGNFALPSLFSNNLVVFAGPKKKKREKKCNRLENF